MAVTWPAPDILTHELALHLADWDDAPHWGPKVPGLPGTGPDETFKRARRLIARKLGIL